jgi:hypothetical protein
MNIARVPAEEGPGQVLVERAAVLDMPGRVLGQWRHRDRHPAQAGLFRAVGLGVLQDGAQVVIARDDVVTLIGVGLQHGAGLARIGQDLPEPLTVDWVEKVKMGREVLHLKGRGIVDGCHRGLRRSKPPTTAAAAPTRW